LADVADIQMDEEAIRELYSDTEGPIGEIITAATEVVGRYAQATAPVSPTGSKAAPPGFLKGTIGPASQLHHDDVYGTGFVMGLAGTHTNRRGGGYPYPLAFISNPKMFTWNRGKRSFRLARNRFIQQAAIALDGFTYTAE
jgi:hypothetical protein